jgi:hypothetical protein
LTTLALTVPLPVKVPPVSVSGAPVTLSVRPPGTRIGPLLVNDPPGSLTVRSAALSEITPELVRVVPLMASGAWTAKVPALEVVALSVRFPPVPAAARDRRSRRDDQRPAVTLSVESNAPPALVSWICPELVKPLATVSVALPSVALPCTRSTEPRVLAKVALIVSLPARGDLAGVGQRGAADRRVAERKNAAGRHRAGGGEVSELPSTCQRLQPAGTVAQRQRD